MDRTPSCVHDSARSWSCTASDTRERVAHLWQAGLKAHDQGCAIRSLTVETLSRERERMHQYWIDSEIAATERSIRYLEVPGRAGFPQLAALDPYFLAAAEPEQSIARLADAALSRTSIDRVTVSVSRGRGLVIEAARAGDTGDRPCGAGPARSTGTVAPVVWSVPLIATTGRVLGTFSCRYDRPGPGVAEDRPLLDLLASAVERLLQWHGTDGDISRPWPVRTGAG